MFWCTLSQNEPKASFMQCGTDMVQRLWRYSCVLNLVLRIIDEAFIVSTKNTKRL